MHHIRIAHLYATAVSGIAIIIATPALAQDPAGQGVGPTATGQASTGGATAANREVDLQEIIVTARRVNENLQRVPVAASVLNSEALQKQRVLTASDIQYHAPSLVITPDPLSGSSNPVFQLRGQASPLGTDNTVVTYFGDVPVDARVIASGLFDLDSVQVIRGPQGTLFGKNSTGGAVLFSPKTANVDDWSGYLQGDIGNYNLHELTGAVNIPVLPGVLGVRISGQTTRQDGFVRNLSGPAGNDKHYDALHLEAHFTPTSNVTNDFLFTYFRSHQHLNPPITAAINVPLLSYFLGAYPPSVLQSVKDAFAHQQALGNRTIDESFSKNPDNNTSYLFSNATTVQLGNGMAIKNIIGYWHVDQYLDLNQTQFSAFPIIDVSEAFNIHQISDELQLTGKSFNDSLTWIAGGFISHQRTALAEDGFVFTTFPSTEPNSLDVYNSKALFGQATLDFSNIGLNGVKLTGGYRHTWDDRRGQVTDLLVPGSLTGDQFQGQQNSWTVGLDYQVTHNILLYVASRHSYKAGGFNLISPIIPAEFVSFKPETMTDVEMGVKAEAQVGPVPVRANLALYRGDYKNIDTQVVGTCTDPVTHQQISSSLIVNAGEGTPKGLELELEASLTQRLHASAFYNMTLGKYKSFQVPGDQTGTCSIIGQSINAAGENFGNISRNTGGVTVSYSLPLIAPKEELVLTGNIYSRSKRLGNDLQGFLAPAPGYTLLNLRLDYNSIGGSPFSVGAYMKNVTNETYVLTRNLELSETGYDTYTFGDPRTFGVEATYRF